ncbi:MAG: DNA-binding response regulator [Candidatus Roseilinea sp.]|nr:MAG: DNA-binding response regulator [Candidatus Roseilinea sp.]
MIRVVIFDNELAILEALRETLSGQPDVEIMGEATGADELLQLVHAYRPDVALAGTSPSANLPDVIRQLRSQFVALGIVVFASLDDVVQMSAVLDAGALGYCLRCDELSYVAAAIRAVASGLPCESPTARRWLLERLAAAPDPTVIARFTQREREVLKRLAQGMGRQEIADALRITDRTVREYLERIEEKTGLATREQLIAYAAKHRFDLL